MKLKMRNPEEMKAYVEGYNACNKQFKEYLTGCNTIKAIKDAIKKMDLIVATVNAVIDKEVENDT